MTTLAWRPAQVRLAWRWPLAVTLGLLALLLLGYRDTAAAMVTIWIRSETFTHAFVVPPIVAWLIWRKRSELAPLTPRPQPWMLLPMVALALMWWLGQLVNVAAATQLALTAMLVAAVPLVLGWQVTRVLGFPLAFMFFSVPIGEFLTPTLMHWTAEALVAGLRLTGIPVYQEGQQLVIPSGRWAVVAACSGIRYLMATFMVGSLFAYLNYTSTRKRLIFVLISLVLPVLANWVRAYIIVMLGHLSNNEIATGVDHLVYGWVFFGVVILSLFFIGARWADDDDGPQAAARAERLALVQPQAEVALWRPLVLAVVALLAVMWPMSMLQRQDMHHAPVHLVLPDALGGWQATPVAGSIWAPFFANATLHRAKEYQGLPGQVGLHLSYYRGHGGDVKLVSSENRFVEGGDERWHVLSEGQASAVVDGRTVTWRRATLLGAELDGRSGAQRQHLTVWRLYWIGGHLTHGDIKAKLLQAWLAVRGEPDDGAAIHLVSTLDDDAAAQRQLSAFVGENFGRIQHTLAQARESR